VVHAVGDQFGRQQRRPLDAGMAHSEHLPDERPGHADLLTKVAAGIPDE
jgi:hypothetical protein